jgi:glycosyltransferase 2 family protein
MRPQIKTLIILLVTIALVAWFLRQANISDVWREIRAAEPWALVLAFGMSIMTYVLRTLRWQYLLRPIGVASFRNAFRTTVIGFAANAMLPARVGEVLRPYLLARREGLSAPSTFATIILERLLDLLTVLLFFGLFVLLFDTGMGSVNKKLWDTIRIGGLLAAAGAVAALIMIALLARIPEKVGTTVERVARVLPERFAAPVAHAAHRFVEGLAVTRDPWHLLVSFLLSIPLWLSIAMTVWSVTLAFHMTIPYTGMFLMLVLLTVGVAVPTPGAVGGFHEAFRIAATGFYGMPNDRAVGAAIVLHMVVFLPVIGAGAWFMFQEGLDLAGIRRMSEEARAQESLP